MSGIWRRATDLNNLNYTAEVPYNGTIPTGGDSLHQNLNVFYEVPTSRQPGDKDPETDLIHSLAISRGSSPPPPSFFS